MRRSTRRLLLLLAGLPIGVLVIGVAYMEAMTYIEGTPRDIWTSIEWAAETLTTTGYGADPHWSNPWMVMFVVIVQFMGLFLVFLIFPVYVIPFFEERFEARLPNTLPLPGDKGYVLIYGYGAAVSTLIEELKRHRRRIVILDSSAQTCRLLHEQGMEAVHLPGALDDFRFQHIDQALAIVANGSDQDNGALMLMARERGFEGSVYAFVEDPLHRQPLQALGAAAVYTPAHLVASALAARASRRIHSSVHGVQLLGADLGVAELRIHRASLLVGTTLADARFRERHGIAVLGRWRGGQFTPRLFASTPLRAGDILLVVGRKAALTRMDRLAVPLSRTGPIVIAGFGDVGRKVQKMLADASEQTVVVDQVAAKGVDVVGNVLDTETLKAAGIAEASTVVLAVSDDSTGLFAATVVRELLPDVPLVARVNQPESVDRLYRVGADFAISASQVSGQLLAQHLLGEEYISLERNLKLSKVDAAGLAGRHPLTDHAKGYQVVAVERDGEVVMEFPEDFRIQENDAVYLAGDPQAIDAISKSKQS